MKRKTQAEMEKEAYKAIGRRGGMANFKKHGKEYMSQIGKKGMQQRWKNNKKEDNK